MGGACRAERQRPLTCRGQPTLLAPVRLRCRSSQGEGEEEAGDDGEAEAAVEVAEAGMRKSSRTEHVDFKAREEER